MFRWLLKPKFYSKCISYVKFIKTRLETIQKKRNAVEKFMKGDIAELLRKGFDYEAYKRAEGLLFEQNKSSCYEFIAKFIECISDHVEDLTKQKDCPDECKEAVPSLMYAAARFADLPELRDLRTLFTEKFGNSLEPYICKEFVEKLRRDPPTREMKIRLLHDIAQEFSIEWDNKALEQRHYRPHEERPNVDKTDNLVNEREHTNTNGRHFNTSKGKERDTQSQVRRDFIDDPWRHQSSSDDDTSTDMSSVDERKASVSSLGSPSEDEVEFKKPSSYWLVPPPYLKQKTNKTESNLKKTTDSETYDAATKLDSSQGKTYPPSQQPEYDTGQNRRRTKSYVRGTSLPSEHTNSVEKSKGHTRTISLDQEIGVGGGRVHPNLPDYDELATRLAALRKR